MSNDFRHNVETMIPALRRYARALARDSDIADDLVQDTLVRALRSFRAGTFSRRAGAVGIERYHRRAIAAEFAELFREAAALASRSR